MSTVTFQEDRPSVYNFVWVVFRESDLNSVGISTIRSNLQSYENIQLVVILDSEGQIQIVVRLVLKKFYIFIVRLVGINLGHHLQIAI